MKQKVITRFAPSPTGLMHLGHAYSAFFAFDLAKAAGGDFILRIEDIDLTRRKPEFMQAITDDLAWLGLEWEQPVRQQSAHFSEYEQQLKKLQDLGIIYPCYCSRREINQARDEMLHAPHGLGDTYPQICKNRPQSEIEKLMQQGREPAYRLDLKKALALIDLPPIWHDLNQGEQAMDFRSIGDIILARRDIKTSYHLAVTHDDNLQSINLITRGSDLMAITPLHMLLQQLLGYQTPFYAHHDLITDGQNNRLAKSQNSPSLQSLKSQGFTAQDIRQQVGAMGTSWQKNINDILEPLQDRNEHFTALKKI